MNEGDPKLFGESNTNTNKATLRVIGASGGVAFFWTRVQLDRDTGPAGHGSSWTRTRVQLDTDTGPAGVPPPKKKFCTNGVPYRGTSLARTIKISSFGRFPAFRGASGGHPPLKLQSSFFPYFFQICSRFFPDFSRSRIN